MVSMSYGFDIDLDFGLYMKDNKDTKKSKRRRQKDHEKGSKRKRMASNLGLRDSEDSMGVSTTSGFNIKGNSKSRDLRIESRNENFNSSRHSSKRGSSLSKAHIS